MAQRKPPMERSTQDPYAAPQAMGPGQPPGPPGAPQRKKQGQPPQMMVPPPPAAAMPPQPLPAVPDRAMIQALQPEPYQQQGAGGMQGAPGGLGGPGGMDIAQLLKMLLGGMNG